MNSKEISKLEYEILGSYDFVGTKRIKLKDNSTIDLTILHEEAHSLLTDISSFGQIQKILAFIIKHQGTKLNLSNITDLKDALRLTIKNSIITHEGFASWRQLEIGKTHYLEFDISKLPELYRNSLLKFQSVSDALPESLKQFQFEIVQVMAQITMNTSIYEVDFGIPFRRVLKNHFKKDINRPDYRLNFVIEGFLSMIKKQKFEKDLLKHFEKVCAKNGYKNNNRILFEAQNSALNYLDLLEDWKNICTDILYKHIKDELFPFEIFDIDELEEDLFDYDGKTKEKLFSSFNIQIPKLVKSDGDYSRDAMIRSVDMIDFKPDKRFEPIAIPIKNIPKDYFFKIQKNPIFLVIELNILELPSSVNKHNFNSLEVLTAVSKDNDEINFKSNLEINALKFLRERVVFYGNLNEVKEHFKSYLGKIFILTVNWNILMYNNFHLPDGVKELCTIAKKEPASIFGTTKGRFFFIYLKKLEKVGIEEGSSFGMDDNVMYFYFKLKTGVICITKCSLAYIEIIGELKVKEWDLISKYISNFENIFKNNEKDHLKFLKINYLVELDKNGAFNDDMVI